MLFSPINSGKGWDHKQPTRKQEKFDGCYLKLDNLKLDSLAHSHNTHILFWKKKNSKLLSAPHSEVIPYAHSTMYWKCPQRGNRSPSKRSCLDHRRKLEYLLEPWSRGEHEKPLPPIDSNPEPYHWVWLQCTVMLQKHAIYYPSIRNSKWICSILLTYVAKMFLFRDETYDIDFFLPSLAQL